MKNSYFIKDLKNDDDLEDWLAEADEEEKREEVREMEARLMKTSCRERPRGSEKILVKVFV